MANDPSSGYAPKAVRRRNFPFITCLKTSLMPISMFPDYARIPLGPLFPPTRGNSRELGTRSMTRIDAARMLKRRLAQAGIVGTYSPHSFRASGLTRFLEEGGTLEGHRISPTTPTAGPRKL